LEVEAPKQWVTSRVIRCVCEKMAQNVAQAIFVKTNS
jgi:hypothetical protein